MMTSKLNEELTIQTLLVPSTYGPTTETRYNQSAGNGTTVGSGIGIDTRGYEEVLIILGRGAAKAGNSTADVAAIVLESATDNANTATAVASLTVSANFTSTSSTSANSVQYGSIVCKNTRRYLYLRTQISGTVDLAAMAILGKSRTLPAGIGIPCAFDVGVDARTI